jgi:tape measure domain-containing protein
MAEIYGFTINIDGNAIKSIDAIDANLNKLTGKAQQSDSVFGGLFKFEMFKQAAGMVFNAGKSIVEFGIQTEQTRTAFDVMLGSVDKGRAMFESLKQFADVTPFDNDTTYQAGRMLLNYGIQAKNVIPYMQMLGDTSGGVKERFEGLTRSFAQVSAEGKLTGRELREMINSGFNPLQEMSSMTGKSIGALKKEMEDGHISFETMVQTFQHATSEGGRFNGMMDKQSQTVGGLFSTVAGNAQTAMYGMFQRMAPMLKDIANAGINVAQAFGEWVTPKQSEILSDQRMEMIAMFEVLKKGNLPLDQRHEIMAKLNTDYKDYIPQLITDKTTSSELNTIQEGANKVLLQKIKIQAQSEVFAEYFKKAAQAGKDLLKASMQVEENKMAPEDIKGAEKYRIDGKYVGQKEMHQLQYQKNLVKAQKESDQATAELQKLLATDTFKDTNFWSDVKTKGVNATKKEVMDKFSKNMGANQKGTVGGSLDALKDSAMATSNLGPSGGLGQAKTINMNFNQPLMQINADKIDGQDMQDNAELVINQLARELHNIAYEQGVM